MYNGRYILQSLCHLLWSVNFHESEDSEKKRKKKKCSGFSSWVSWQTSFLSPFYQQTRWVNQSYPGVIQNGQENTPWVSISQAFSSIVDAAPDNRYKVRIAPGIFTEGLLHFPADIFLEGYPTTADVMVNSEFDLDHVSWLNSTVSPHESGFYGLTFTSGNISNFTFIATNGDFFMYDVVWNSMVSILSELNATRFFVANSIFEQDLQVQGTISTFSNAFFNADLDVESSQNTTTQVIATGGFLSGHLNATWFPTHFFLRLLLPRLFMSDSLILNGAGCSAKVNRYSLLSPVELTDNATLDFYEHDDTTSLLKLNR